MSILSPAKQERIERHLMRQRGPGVRTVSANFGFSFGNSAPSSSEAASPCLEPPLKRRKTILRDVVCATKSVVDAVEHVVRLEDSTVLEPLKKRRRWKPEDEVARQQKENAADEDSFVARLKAKKAAYSKTKTTIVSAASEHTEVDVAEPAKKGRPRRRAASKAAVHVKSDYMGNESAVDERRSFIEAKEKPKRAGKKKTAVPELDNNERQEDLVETAKLTRRKRRKCPDLIDRQKLCEHESGPSAKRRAELNNNKDDAIPVKRKPNKTKANPIRETLPSIRLSIEPGRQPLQETDMNVTIRSTSPEKAPLDSKPQATSRKRAAEKIEDPQIEDIPSVRPGKRRKVQVRRDDEQADVCIEKAPVRTKLTVLDDADHTPASPQKPFKPTKRVKPTSRKSAVQETETKDEDIDWLFEPQARQIRLPPSTRRTPCQNNVSKPSNKMPDIDLDDLLSGIASIAKTSVTAQGRKGKI